MDKDMPQFARIACAYMPDQMPQRIKEALEDDGYSFRRIDRTGQEETLEPRLAYMRPRRGAGNGLAGDAPQERA